MGWLSKLFNLETYKEAGASLGASGAKDARTEASKRLKLVLMHDRTQLSPAMLETMRDELVEVISKYVEIDKSALDLCLESESNTIALVANIPVIRARGGDKAEGITKTARPADAKPVANKPSRPPSQQAEQAAAAGTPSPDEIEKKAQQAASSPFTPPPQRKTGEPAADKQPANAVTGSSDASVKTESSDQKPAPNKPEGTFKADG